MAVLLPLAFIAGAQVWRMRAGKAWPLRPLLVAASLMLVPALLWAVARWRADQWTFLQLLITQDLFLASTRALEGHAGSLLYYPDILQRYQYDWLIAALVAGTLFWTRVRECARRQAAGLRQGEGATFIALAWTVVSLGVLTAMQTKLPWYLNPLYPVFALAVAGVLGTGLFATERPASFSSANSARSMEWRRRTVWVVAALALVVAETKLLWQPVHNRDLAGSTQELLMSARQELEGHAVFRPVWLRDEVFVLSGISRASPAMAIDVTSFLEIAEDGDFLLAEADLRHPGLALVLSNGRHALFRRQ
jgi:4-amino-4-deoxy-L-arabinose transferase-like glycosyltransferase